MHITHLQHATGTRRRGSAFAGTLSILLLFSVFIPKEVLAQGTTTAGTAVTPLFWYLLAGALALLVPAGLVLLGVAGLDPRSAWTAALGALGAVGLAALSYWAVGFALQFGGVGLVYPDAGLRALVWEWSPLPTSWGSGWGVAGLAGWFLSGGNVTALAYALFLAQLPWVIAAALLVVMALRGRTPSVVTLLLALLMGGLIYPLAGNWVQGGGWLNALGRNLNLGHGFIDFSGAGTVFLVAAGFSLAALTVWRGRYQPEHNPHELPPAQLPLLAVVGAFLLLAGGIGWLWSNPLQVNALTDLGLMRGSVNIVLSAAAGALIPLLYSWFVSGASHPTMSGRGLMAGLVAGFAVGPFVQPGPAFLCGLTAGATVPFVTHFVDLRLRLHDATGVLSAAGLPAILGLLFVGIFADGVVGAGWQMTGMDSYLGVTGQGVSGLLTAGEFSRDFPGQFQAQLIGATALGLWGFLTGMIICIPLGLLTHFFARSASRRGTRNRSSRPPAMTPGVAPAAAQSRTDQSSTAQPVPTALADAEPQ